MCGFMSILHFLDVFYKNQGKCDSAHISVSGVECVCLTKLACVVPFIKKYLQGISLDPEKVTFSCTTALR